MTRFRDDRAGSHPLVTELATGTYFWCSCGKTAKVPFCDGSHGRSGMRPVMFRVAAPTTYEICDCGLTGDPPFCDRSHCRNE